MTALVVCAIAMATCYWAGRRSLGQGLVALAFFGYFYGILRANLLTSFSHFIFDAGTLGLYLAFWSLPWDLRDKLRRQTLVWWSVLLIGWPCLLLLLPFQPFLVSLVGLRGAIFFLPALLIGCQLKRSDLIELSTGLSILTLISVAFGTAEYFLGVPRFYPRSPVTELIYISGDVAGGFFRIPAIFTSAHAFGGTMVGTIPFSIGLWTMAENRMLKMLGLISIPAALLGVLMSATRLNFVVGCVMIAFVIFTTRLHAKYRVAFVLIICGIAAVALSNVRFQRFKSLKDTDYVQERVAGSVNRGFFEILSDYPMGNGLGGGGTSIPYFLQGEVRNPIGMENEYARILGEQGIIGLMLWVSFLAWVFSRISTAYAAGPWSTTRRLVWSLIMFDFATAWIGTGLLTSIPGTLFLMLGLGWTLVPQRPEPGVAPKPLRSPARYSHASRVPAIQSVRLG
jgi:hypothetical protein